MNKLDRVYTPTPGHDPATLPDLGTALIDPERFWRPEVMAREWDRIWTKVWNMGPRLEELPEPGDYALLELGRESFIFVRGQDGQVRGFFNVCRHRGNRLALGDSCGHAKSFQCGFHHWEWHIDGSLKHIPDQDSYPQFRDGVPCDKLGLKPVRVDCWGGWVWYTLNQAAEPLRAYLGAVADHLDPYEFERATVIDHKTFEWDCNWKASVDAFNESYHVQGVHPQLLDWINDYSPIDILGIHSRMITQFGTVSPRCPEQDRLGPGMRALMSALGIHPDDYDGPPKDVRLEVQRRKRAVQDDVHFPYKNLTDEQLSDDYHYCIFPNVTFNTLAESVMVFRHRPHPTDPTRMFWDLSFVQHLPPGTPPPEFTHRTVKHGVEPIGDVLESEAKSMGTIEVLEQDAYNMPHVQAGLMSQAYDGYLIGDQELRVRHFHKVVDDFLAR